MRRGALRDGRERPPRIVRRRARPSSASTSSSVERIRRVPGTVRRPLHEPRADPGRAALRARPAGDHGRPLGGQGGRVEGARARRPRHRLARHRDRAAADRPAGGPPPRPGRGPGRAARDGPDRRLDHPRVRLRGRDRVRHPDGRRPLPLPARYRGAARRPRAADPRPDRAAARPGRGGRRRVARHGRAGARRLADRRPGA